MFRQLPLVLVHLIAVVAIGLYGAAASATVARGAISQIVICSADGPTTVHVDVDGNKTKRSACCDCQKCLLFSGYLPLRAGQPTKTEPAAISADTRYSAAPIPAIPHLRPQPRGPPIKPEFVTRLEFRQESAFGGVAQTGRPFEDVR